MSDKKWKELSREELEKKEQSLKVFIGIFIPIIIALFFFVGRDYFSGEEVDMSLLTIAICSLGGPATLYPELKEVRKELKARD